MYSPTYFFIPEYHDDKKKLIVFKLSNLSITEQFEGLLDYFL